MKQTKYTHHQYSLFTRCHPRVLVASINSFCTAQTWPHTHISPEFLCQLAPATKQASSGPREVANIPAPQGQCILAICSLPLQRVFVLPSKTILSIFSMLVQATVHLGSETPHYWWLKLVHHLGYTVNIPIYYKSWDIIKKC